MSWLGRPGLAQPGCRGPLARALERRIASFESARRGAGGLEGGLTSAMGKAGRGEEAASKPFRSQDRKMHFEVPIVEVTRMFTATIQRLEDASRRACAGEISNVIYEPPVLCSAWRKAQFNQPDLP